ncbi:TetR/AcrR family transcriptional regulator [Foetidibacter luteolus]|uniref:TetR/AcrR family transcriptional regulator n=1 Tax=Foetidibacter luteolus TaxID=2608880 RepID=UPI00129B4663|nr:TetR/AcrR family transcriptional regulator [Foetidibacter luteolus]
MKKAEKTRQFIIEKAAPIINRKGMAGTSISDIMQATQLAKGGVYGNFESKEEICAAALDYLLSKTYSQICAKVDAKASYKEKLFAFLDFYKTSAGQQDNYGCPMLNFGAEADDTNPDIKLRVSKAISDTENLVATLVNEGIKAGEFLTGFNAALFSVKALTMIEGGLWASRVQANSHHIKLVTDLLKKEIEDNTK